MNSNETNDKPGNTPVMINRRIAAAPQQPSPGGALAPRAPVADNALNRALKRARAGSATSPEQPTKKCKSDANVQRAELVISERINASGTLKIMPPAPLCDLRRACELQRTSEHSMCPYTFIQSMLAEGDAQTSHEKAKRTRPLHASEFIAPTEEEMAAYTSEAVAAVRSGDVEALRRILDGGGTLRCCNRFGESLLHAACRRGSVEVVAFLLGEAGVSPRIRDDYGRTPLHDACWCGTPQYAIVELLLKSEPRLAFVKDVRGHKPFQYARREHWGAWRDFLRRKRDLLLS